MRLSRFLLPLVAVLALALPLGAQGVTTGTISGRVTDAAGTPLGSATISATNVATGFTRNTLSEDDGTYALRFLPPGQYTVTARRIGQQPREVAGVRVIIGTVTPLNFTLQAAAVQLEQVRVVAQTGIDVNEGGVRTTVTEEEIENLPSLGRDFTDFINLDGRVSPTPEETTGGQFSIAGMRPSQTNVQIDGVDANFGFFGENRGGSRIPFAFSLESIREFQIVTNGYDVEYGNYSGGVVNIVTKGGTNTFGGTVYANYRGDALTAENFDGTKPNDYEVQQYAVQVEGPIVRDKLHFLASLDGQRRREPFNSISIERLRASENPGDTVALQRFFDILEQTYGIPNPESQYGRFLISNDVLTLFGRVDWTINDMHRLSVRNNFSDWENANEAGSFAVNAGRSQAELILGRANSLVGELTSVLGRNAFNVFRAQWSTEDRPRVGNELRPELAVRAAPGLTLEYGGSLLSFNNDLTENKLQIIDNVTLDRGSHTFKFGTNNIFTHIENAFWFNGSGQYFFPSLDAFAAREPSSFVRNLRADGQPPTATFDVQEYSVYAQDEWRVTPTITAMLGLRYDVGRYGDAPGRVLDVERAFGLRTGNAPVDKNNLSPRASLTWDRSGNGTEVIKVGAGLFYGRVPYVLGSNVAITDIPLLVLECRGRIADLDPDAPPVPDYPSFDPSGADNPVGCLGTSRISGVPEYSFWTDDFSIPETFKASAGYERFLTLDTKVGLDVLFSSATKLYTVRNLNLRDPVFILDAEGDRRIFVPEAQFDPTQAAGPIRLRNADFGNIYVNHNDGVARVVSASTRINHRLSELSTFEASYTYTWAKDNSSFSCCTSNEGFTGQDFGILGPNLIGAVGDRSAGWGPSEFERRHTFVFAGYFTLPYDFKVTGIMRLQSGTPWSPEVRGDINGDGVRFNDRPFIFRPEDLPVYTGSATGAEAEAIVAEQRARYAAYLRDHECVGDFVGRVVPRNTCRQPWFNRVDLSIRKAFDTWRAQHAELHIDIFNVLNLLNDDWGRYEAVQSANRNLLEPEAYDPNTGQILYIVPERGVNGFAHPSTLGSNLLLQGSAQIGVRYVF